MPGHHQTHRQKEYLHNFLGNRVQRVSRMRWNVTRPSFIEATIPPSPGLSQHDAGRRLRHIGRRRHRDSHLCLAQRRCVVSAVAAHPDNIAALLQRLDEIVLSLW